MNTEMTLLGILEMGRQSMLFHLGRKLITLKDFAILCD